VVSEESMENAVKEANKLSDGSSDITVASGWLLAKERL
jgi:hypothetical protein